MRAIRTFLLGLGFGMALTLLYHRTPPSPTTVVLRPVRIPVPTKGWMVKTVKPETVIVSVPDTVLQDRPVPVFLPSIPPVPAPHPSEGRPLGTPGRPSLTLTFHRGNLSLYLQPGHPGTVLYRYRVQDRFALFLRKGTITVQTPRVVVSRHFVLGLQAKIHHLHPKTWILEPWTGMEWEIGAWRPLTLGLSVTPSTFTLYLLRRF